MILPILQEPNERLRRISASVEVFDDELRAFAQRLADTRRHFKAIGLAAPQVGKAIRLVSIDPGRSIGFAFMVNPEIVAHGNNKSVGSEGCLSIDNVKKWFRIKRWDTITVRFQNLHGETKQVVARGLGARVVQHEVDHLEGRLIGATP
jgi:peptide deformylase